MLPEFDPNIERVFDPTIETRLIVTPEPDLNAQVAKLSAKLARLEAERKRLKPQVRFNTELSIVGLIMIFVVSLSLIPKNLLNDYEERIKEAGQIGVGLVTVINLIYKGLKLGRPKIDDDRNDSDEDQDATTADNQQ